MPRALGRARITSLGNFSLNVKHNPEIEHSAWNPKHDLSLKTVCSLQRYMYCDGTSALMGSLEKIAACLQWRSLDTIETLARKSDLLTNVSLQHDVPRGAARVIAGSNLQKIRERGITGVAFDYHGDMDLAHLDSVTERVFGGTSFVRCKQTAALDELLTGSQVVLGQKLAAFCGQKRRVCTKSPKINDLMPGMNSAVDFYWANVSIKYHDDRRKNSLLTEDFNNQRFHFYELCFCVQDDLLAQCADYAVRDVTPWTSVLDGYIGLYKQHQSTGASYFLGCNSFMPGIATTFVTSVKHDLSRETTIQDYVNSKEMWFIENINRRNRLRLLRECAVHLNIEVITTHDFYAHRDMEPTVAYEAFGHLYEYVENVKTRVRSEAKLVDVVTETRTRHYLGCTEATTVHEPIAFELGPKEGFVMLYPQEQHGLPLDGQLTQSVTISDPANARDCVIPITNIQEQSLDDVHAVDSQVGQMRCLTVDEILFTAFQTGQALSPSVLSLLHARDAYNHPLVYGVQYPDGLPIVLYPTKAIQHSVQLTTAVDADSFIAFAEMKPNATAKTLRRTYQECMCLDMEVPVETMFSRPVHKKMQEQAGVVRLEWDAHMLNTILLFCGHRSAHFSTCQLTTVCVDDASLLRA